MERKYALTRLSKGDYLLPSNDAQTLWRVYTYEEDGSASFVIRDGSEQVIKGIFWALAKRPMPNPDVPFDLEEWEGWVPWADLFDSRKEAIEDALRYTKPEV